MDLFEALHQDHEKVSSLFTRIESAEAGKRDEIFKSIRMELEMHSQAEEEFFYPELEERDETADLVRHSFTEHTEVKDKLAEIAGMDKGDRAFLSRIRELREAVEHHVREEEDKLFPLARKLLDQDTQESILEDIQELKEERMAGI